jgi:hypothetical protein
MYRLHIILVPVPQYDGTVVPSGTISLVPSILPPLDQGEWTVSKNANEGGCNSKKRPTMYAKFNLG